jgi:outer membrane protein
MANRISFAPIRRAIACLCAAAVLCPASGGLHAGERRVLTLGDAVAAAMRSNLELRQAATGMDASRLALRRAKSNYLPSLGLSARGSESWSKRYDSAADDYEGATSRSVSLGLSSSLELFSGMSRINSVKQARLDLEAEEQSFVRTRQSVLYDVVGRFMQAVLDKEILAVNEANLASQRRSLEHIDAFVVSGKRPVADLYQQQAAAADAEANILEAGRKLEISVLQLLQTMGSDPADGYTVVEPDAETLIAGLDSLLGGFVSGGEVARRPDVVAQRKAKEAAEKQIAIAGAGYWPSLNLSASVGTSYHDPASIPGDYADQFDRNLNASIGISASLSLFDRFQTRNSVSQARIGLRRSQISLETLELRARIEAVQAHSNYETARKTIDVAAAQLVYAEQALRNYEERYRLGLSTLLELLQARAVFVQSSYSVARSKYDLIVKAAALLYAVDDIERALYLFN